MLFIVALVVAYPYYQYYIDPDATAYLTLAKRYAEGDYAKAINGYWSPWAIWLTALLIKAGTASFKAAIMVNAVGALGFLYISHSLMLFFSLRRDAVYLLTVALSFFLLYAVFWQSFDDLWECFFLLLVLRIILTDCFIHRPLLWIAAGVFGALAYLAKAYALPFFILEIACCTWLINRQGKSSNKLQWLKAAGVCIFTMLLVSAPWIYLLCQKYGVWTTGTAGSLNMSWYLVGHPYWRDDIQALLPPIYSDSPSYWEDAYLVNGATPHFWSTPKLFLLQIIKTGYNLLKFIQSINELTAFFLLALIIAFLGLSTRRQAENDGQKLSILCLSFLLFPVGYFLINFQARYLWYMLPLCIVIVTCALQSWTFFSQFGKPLQRFILIVFAFSIMAYPALGLKDMLNKGKQEWIMAQALKQQHITGSFTTNIPYGPRTQDIIRLSYFSGNPYYNMPLPTSKGDLLSDIRRYKVKYYFHFYDTPWDDFHPTDEHNQPLLELFPGQVPGLKVFLLTP
jgi:hypothetical protein